MKLKAFTLAEVMIVLGIIGVVAAITIPTLNVKTEEARFIAQLHKAENSLQNALKLAIMDNDNLPIKHWESYAATTDPNEKTQAIQTALKAHLNVANNCENLNQCFALNNYKTLQKTTLVSVVSEKINVYNACFMTSDGIAFSIAGPYIFVDLNGPQKPNIAGVDFFLFELNTETNKLKANNRVETECNITTPNEATGLGCTEWALRKGNMDYRRKVVNW